MTENLETKLCAWKKVVNERGSTTHKPNDYIKDCINKCDGYQTQRHCYLILEEKK